MADLSIYLFWVGFAFSALAVLAYTAFAFRFSFAPARLAATGNMTLAMPAPPAAGMGRFATSLLGLATLALGGAVAARWAAVDHAPMSNLYEFTVAFAFAVAAAYLAFETATGLRRTGVVAVPIVVALLLIATQFPSDIIPLVPALQNGPLLTIHVTCMMVSYAVLTVAFCGAFIAILQGGEGRRRFAALPSGTAAADLAHRAVLVGFPLLGIGIALGAWWANSAWGRYWGWDPKETSALVTWLALAAYFHARAGTGTVAAAPGFRRFVPARLRRSARPSPLWWIVVMWGLLLFTYFGVNLWVSGLHSYAGV